MMTLYWQRCSVVEDSAHQRALIIAFASSQQSRAPQRVECAGALARTRGLWLWCGSERKVILSGGNARARAACDARQQRGLELKSRALQHNFCAVPTVRAQTARAMEADLSSSVQYLSSVEQTGTFASLHLFYMTSRNSMVKHLRRLNRLRGVDQPAMDFLDEHVIGCNPTELGLTSEKIQALKRRLMLNPVTRDVFRSLHVAPLSAQLPALSQLFVEEHPGAVEAAATRCHQGHENHAVGGELLHVAKLPAVEASGERSAGRHLGFVCGHTDAPSTWRAGKKAQGVSMTAFAVGRCSAVRRFTASSGRSAMRSRRV